MKKGCLLLIGVLCYCASAIAQYAPQAGITGSTAIAASSPLIKGWATHCSLKRGLQDIAQPSLGYTFIGDSSLALGPADNFVVSLGDSGVATLQFAYPVFNGPGADFVVFENGFADPGNPEAAFLELAFVEVSSDGIQFFRFPAQSLTQTDTQIAGAGVYMNARKLDNLAGKYISGFGTPFDLQEMAGITGLDIQNITHIRIVDVIGAITGTTSLDAANRIINDPYPTAFPTGGFDLDAVGLIHQHTTSVICPSPELQVQVFPNPATDWLFIRSKEPVKMSLTDLTGKILSETSILLEGTLSLAGLSSGIYLLHFRNSEGTSWSARISKL